MSRIPRALLIMLVCVCGGADVHGQTAPEPKPSIAVGRASLYGMTSRTTGGDVGPSTENTLNLSLTFRPPDEDGGRYDYGLDLRYATFTGQRARPARTSIYEAFAGASLGDGSLWVRGGSLWLNDLGALGSLTGGMVEYRRPRRAAEDARLRFGAFGGLEPNILDVGYVHDVSKFGGYVTYEGKDARRDTVGYVLVRNAGMTERSVLTTTNYIPAGRKLFVYQAAEFDVSRPAGRADGGLTYMFATARVVPSERFDVQGLYQRGRSIDARGLIESLSTGRPLTPQAIAGLLYQSTGGRASFNMPAGSIGSLTIYGGYYRDRNDQASAALERTVVGGQLANILGRNIDLTASDSRIGRADGAYHSRYFSVGKQITDRIYVTGDYSTSLSIVRFTPSSGVTVESRPRTTRWSGTMNANVTRMLGLLVIGERTHDATFDDLRIVSGLTYRLHRAAGATPERGR